MGDIFSDSAVIGVLVGILVAVIAVTIYLARARRKDDPKL